MNDIFCLSVISLGMSLCQVTCAIIIIYLAERKLFFHLDGRVSVGVTVPGLLQINNACICSVEHLW